MSEYICLGCYIKCIRSDWDLNEMGILVGGEIYDVVCPFSGFDTEFVSRVKEGEE